MIADEARKSSERGQKQGVSEHSDILNEQRGNNEETKNENHPHQAGGPTLPEPWDPLPMEDWEMVNFGNWDFALEEWPLVELGNWPPLPEWDLHELRANPEGKP